MYCHCNLFTINNCHSPRTDLILHLNLTFHLDFRVHAGNSLVNDDTLLQLPFIYSGNKRISTSNNLDYSIPRSMSWHQRQQQR